MTPLLDPTSNEQKYSKLSSAAIIGATTTDSARVWVRIYTEGTWWLVVTDRPIPGDLVRLEEKSLAKFLEGQGIAPVYLDRGEFTQDHNLTGVFDVKGLKADTVYYYAVISDETDPAVIQRRTEMGADAPLCFRTMPAAPFDLTFGFYSCHDHISAGGDAGAWPHFFEQLEEAGARFVIGGGDQAYVDTNSNSGFPDIWVWLKDNKKALLEKFVTGDGAPDKERIERYLLDIYRWFYRVYWSVPALREVYERFPQYMIWDDHEIMDGWGSLTNAERLGRIAGFFEDKDTKSNQLLVDLMWRAACRAYYEYEHSHNPATPIDLEDPDKCQWDYSFRHGNSAFYVLDMRGHHDVEKNKGRKNRDPYIILGKAQFDRFTAWLDGAEAKSAEALFVVSPVPVVHWIDRLVNYADLGEAKDDFMDEWGHESNHWERDELLQAIFERVSKTGATVAILSGDVHCASVFRMRHRKFPAAKVFQVTSSGISRKPAPKLSLLGISSGGPMMGNKEVSCERLYAMAGSKNFVLMRVLSSAAGAETVVKADLNWPGGDAGEVTRRTIVLD
jgi:alkaline phosphatase D